MKKILTLSTASLIVFSAAAQRGRSGTHAGSPQMKQGEGGQQDRRRQQQQRGGQFGTGGQQQRGGQKEALS